LFGLEKVKFLQLEVVVDPSRQTPADMALYAVRSYALQFIADQVQQACDLARNDPQYGGAVDVILNNLTTFNTESSYAQIQGSYGNVLPTLPPTNPDGSYTLNEQDLVNQYQSIVGAVQAMVDSDLNLLESASVAAVRNGTTRRNLAPTVRTLASNDSPANGGSDSCQVNPCKAAQSSVTGLSKLVGLFDPQMGTQISTVGTAGIQAGYSMDQIVKDFENPAINALSLLNPVESIVGAGVSIFSSLFGGNSSANAAVLQQIQKLSQQIARLQADMDAQFAKVDATLNTILTTLNQNFALINYQLGTLNTSAIQIKNALLDVETQLDSTEHYNLAYQQTEEADALMLAVNGCVNYAATHNGQDIGNGTYVSCANTFITWALNNSLDAIWAPQVSSYTDLEVLSFLENFSNSGVCPSGCPTPFAVTTNLISQLPQQSLGLSPLSTLVLANPDEWTLGARLFLLMAFQWPQYAIGLNVSYPTQIGQIGANLLQATNSITTSQSSSGQTSANPAIPNALEVKYSSAITAIQNAASADATAYQNNPANGLTKNGITLALWVQAVNQGASVRSSATSIGFCNGGGETLTPAPSNIFAAAPDLYEFGQGYLSSGTLTMCIGNVQWVNAVDPFTYPPFEPTAWTYCVDRMYDVPSDAPAAQVTDCTIAQLQTTVSVEYNGTTILTATATSTDYLVSRYSGPVCDPDGNNCVPAQYSVDPGYAVQFVWNPSNRCGYTCGDMEQKLNGSSTITQQPQPQLVNAIATQLDSVIATHEQNIYATIASDFNAAGTGMQVAGQQLDLPKLLLQDYIGFGFPSISKSDDILHGLLWGNQAIYGAADVQFDFSAFSTTGITNTADNKVIDEVASMNSRLASLTTEINSALTAVGSNQAPDPFVQIATTLDDLKAYIALQNGNALTPCSFQISPGFMLVGTAGGTESLTVQDPYGCAWIATSGASGLTFGPNSSGTQSGTVTFTIANEPAGLSREAVIIVGDQVLRIVQVGNAPGGSGGGTGGGGAPSVSISPTSVDFGDQTVNATSSPTPINLFNNGSANLTVAGISVSGSYSQTNTCGTLPPGASCIISVVFTPPTIGIQTGALAISDNASGSPQTISLTGVGTAPQGAADFKIDSSTVSVAKGTTGTLGAATLTLTSLNGLSGTVTFSNCVVPSGFVGGSCSVPSPVSLTVSVPATASVTISSSATTAELRPLPRLHWSSYGTGLALSFTIVLGAPLRNRRRRLLSTFLFVFALGGLAACGGGNTQKTLSSPSPSSAIAAGTYSFELTATSGTLTHEVTIAVNVK
jgi:hypothetical protein